jgi:hypothetical protein
LSPVFHAYNTFLRVNAILFACEILGSWITKKKKSSRYKRHELKALFRSAGDEEQQEDKKCNKVV